MEQVEKQTQSSVEFSQNAKGNVQYKVKVYDEDVTEALKKAMETSQKAEKYCKAKNGGV